MKGFRAHSALLLAATASLVASGCMDPHSEDDRGYTKAPLEHAGFVVKGEENGAMRQLGSPNQTRATIVEVAEAPAAAPAAAPAKPVDLPPGVTQAMVDDGKKLFHANTCFACHGPNGAGTPLAPTLADKDWIHIDGSYDAIVAIILSGVPKPTEHPGPMPPKGGSAISDEQVKNVAAYVYSISR
jgi:mono/diheme cytochrome c family protein